jgi:pimeloyl-ACP methyl ester carboxylesterase
VEVVVTRYTLETTGGPLVYEVVGEGDPVLFLAPRCYDRRVWSDVAVLLASSGVRSVMPDERGFGESGNAIGVVDPVRDVSAVMDACDGEGFVVVAADGSADVALALALAKPSSLRGILLINPSLLELVSPLSPWYLEAAGERAVTNLAAMVVAGSSEEAFVARLKQAGASADPEVWERVAAIIGTMNRRLERPPERRVTPTVYPELGRITVPVVVAAVHPAGEEASPVERAIADAIPSARFVEVESSWTTMLGLGEPARCAALVRELVSG